MEPVNEYTIQPQLRDIEGTVLVVHKITGQSEEYSTAWTVPMKRCKGCRVYRVDKRTTPTGYYCQFDFYSIANVFAWVESGQILASCKIRQVEDVRKIIKRNNERSE